MPDYTVIGKEGFSEKSTLPLKLSGKWDYSADHLPDKKLVARSLLSNTARGVIVSIDTSIAEAMPGVKAVVTYKDCPVFSPNILYWGQEIATVAAVDSETASRAIELIKVTLTEGTPVVDPEEARATGAALTGVWTDTNVHTGEVVRGDINAGFSQSDVVLQENTGWFSRYQHDQLEPRAALAWWGGDHLYIWTSSQNPFGHRASLSTQLKHPLNKIHLVSHGTGSGHGDKNAVEFGVVAAVLAKKAGMPVLYHLSRWEHHLTATRQHSGRGEVKIGAKNDGTLMALDCTFYGDDGANGSSWASQLSWPIRSTWKCPNGSFKYAEIATNTQPTGSHRCVADPYGNCIQTEAITMLANRLNMDPVAFMLKNAVTSDMAHQDTKLPFGGLIIKDMIQKAADAIGWTDKWHAPGKKTLADGRLHGIGIAAAVDSHGQLSSAVGAVVHLTRDGKALIDTGQSYCGFSAISECHIVAETLGMNYEDVQLGSIGETDNSSEGGMEAGSTRTITLGAAFNMAAQDALDQAKIIAAGSTLLNVTADKISAVGGKFFETANPGNSKTWAEVAARLTNPIVGRGYTWPKKLRRQLFNWPVGTDCETRGAECAAVELAVDTETGEIEILQHVNVIDAGRVIYRNGALKQNHSGIIMQQGQALMYEDIIDKQSGALLNPNMLNRKLPTTLDIHTDNGIPIFLESDDAAGPFGAHGIGEPVVSAFACIMAAFYNATGKWVSGSPLAPWKVLAALGKA